MCSEGGIAKPHVLQLSSCLGIFSKREMSRQGLLSDASPVQRVLSLEKAGIYHEHGNRTGLEGQTGVRHCSAILIFVLLVRFKVVRGIVSVQGLFSSYNVSGMVLMRVLPLHNHV